MKRILLLLMVIISLSGCTNTRPSNQNINSLRETFEAYLHIINARDLQGLRVYLTPEDTLPFVNGGGHLTLGMADYMQSQQNWFADSTWILESEIESISMHGDMAIIVDNTSIYSPSPEGRNAFKMLVTYVFKYHDGAWKIEADICTPIL